MGLRERFARAVVRTGRPENLAVFRVAVAAGVLISPDFWDAPRWAGLPLDLRVAQTPMLRAFAALPISPALARGALVITAAAAALALVGWRTRWALAVAAVGAFYVLGVPQLFGQVMHDHHLVWFLALLAVSPAGDAWSLDARRARPLRPPLAYALPLFVAWALVGAIYFFPGLWKLRASGLAWITSDNLQHQLWWKWAQGNFVPSLRVDRAPWLCRVGAAGVVAFELSFPFLLPFRRTRPFAACAAWLFHLATGLFMHVAFPSLALSYVMFFDWRRRGRPRARGARPTRSDTCRAVRPIAVVGAVLIGAAVIQGVRGVVDDWPFVCYPTFQNLAGAAMPTLVVFADRADGTTVELPVTPIATDQRQRSWALAWSLLRAERREERVRAYWQALSARPEIAREARDASAIRFVARWIRVEPETRGEAVREELLGTITR